MKVIPLFYANLNATESIVINQGGTSSGKTFSILQVLHYMATQEKLRITVAGMSVPHLKQGAYNDFKRILSDNPDQNQYIISHNQSDRKFTYSNGAYIEFTSFENEQKARGPRRDVLYVNECNGMPYDTYWQLKIRTEQKTFLDYNPSAKFWAHEKLIGKPGVRLIISDHRKNYTLSQERHDEIEDIDDEELWKVYARGLTGQIKGLIYPKWQLCDGIPDKVETVLGLDFGFNHKMALVEVGVKDNRLYWQELIYQSKLTISDLIELMKELNLGRKVIYCDHAAPDKIEDLKRAGFNALPADKDVKNGIDFVKRYQLFVTKDSAGLRKELTSYKWKEKAGKEEEPVKLNDDALDAARYGTYTGFRKAGVKVMAEDDYDPLDELNW